MTLLRIVLFLAAPAAVAAGAARVGETPPPVDAPAATRAEDPAADDDDGLSEQEVARRLRQAKLALEKFHLAVMRGDLESAWDALSRDEKRLSFDNDFAIFQAEIEELRNDESEWVFYRTMTFGEIELDEDEPVYAYATILFEDEDGEEDEDQVDLLLVRGRWYIDGGYF